MSSPKYHVDAVPCVTMAVLSITIVHRATDLNEAMEPIALLWLCLLALSAGILAQDSAPLTCKPQGLLQLDAPYPRPQHTLGGLPVCPQFSCSCCTRAHVLSILRMLAPGLGGGGDAGDGSLSRRCADMTTLMACRICDPEVGTGLKPAVCKGTCDAWQRACADDFFTFDPRSGQLAPCPASGPGAGEPCVRVGDMASDGASLCTLAGLSVSEADSGDACYDGSDPRGLPQGLCLAPPKSARPDTASSGGSSKARKAGDSSDSIQAAKWMLALGMLGCLVYRIAQLRQPRGRFARPGG